MIQNPLKTLPAEGGRGLISHWKTDLWAGFGVWMVSLPIGLSVAFTSGFHPLSGIITVIIGGLGIALLSSSVLSIKGPSVSMIPIIWLAIHHLSLYEITGIKYTLAVIILAGAIQFLIGLLRLTHRLRILSDAVIFGVITALSAWIFIREIHRLIGAHPQGKDPVSLLLELPQSILFTDIQVLFFGLICLFLLFIPRIFNENQSKGIPVVLLLLGVGICSTLMLGAFSQKLIPYRISFQEQSWSEMLLFPDFTKVFIRESIFYAFCIAIIGILESLVNLKSVEVLDQHNRQSSYHREIMLLGLSNILSGFLGGLPLVCTIENSIVNVNRGAQTRWAAFFQGLLMLITLAFGLSLLSLIPNICLVAIIIYITYKFSSPKLIRSIYDIGWDQLLIFGVAFLISFLTNVLLGILGGMLVTLGIYLYMGCPVHALFSVNIKIARKGKYKAKISVQDAALSSNYPVIRRKIHQLKNSEKITIDLSRTKVVDHGFLELMYYYARFQGLNDGQMELQGLKSHQSISPHPLSSMYYVPKNNSVLRPKGNLDERQIDIQAVASINNTHLKTNLTYDGVVLEKFSFAQGFEVRYRENKFMKFYKSSSIEYSDIYLSKGIRMSEQNYKMSVLMIGVLEVALPHFSLSTEDLLDKVWQTMGYEDIDFENYPSFSERYVLNGEDQGAIRNFFKPELIRFLEDSNMNNFQLESAGNLLILFKGRQLMNRVEIEDAVQFAEEFLDIIHEKDVNLKKEKELH